MKDFIDKISPFIVMDILAKARAMPDAIHMEIGEPDLPPSEQVTEAYIKAIRDRQFHYTPAKGLLALREKIAEYYTKKYGVKVSPERILITPGTSGAFLVVFALLSDSEKRIVLSDPSYPCYKNFTYFLGSEPVCIPVGKDAGYEIIPRNIPSTGDIGSLVVSSPSNPTGTLYRAETMKELITLCKERNIRFISDEIYHGLVYDKQEHTALEFSDRAIVINSFSKYFCMPGFRVGWMILPDELVRKAEVIIQNIFIAANTPAQYAATEAFDEAYLQKVRNRFRERRDFLYNELKDIFQIDAFPDGAFYIWADISHYSDNAVEFCRRLLHDTAVAVTPGIDFGNIRTERYVRFAYTQDISQLKIGIERLKSFLNTY